MEEKNSQYEPWQALQLLVQRMPTGVTFHRHPSRRILRAYLQQSLPQRPTQWSKKRAEKLAAGRLTDWTMWEVAVHLDSCPRCRATVKALQHQEAGALGGGWLAHLRTTMTKPKLARVGWALAGVQAALIIAFAVWMNIAPSSLPPKFQVPVYVGLNQTTFENAMHEPSLVKVRLTGNASIGQIINILHELHVELVGPDKTDGYFLLKKYDGAYLTQQDTALIEKLKTYSSLLQITNTSIKETNK